MGTSTSIQRDFIWVADNLSLLTQLTLCSLQHLQQRSSAVPAYHAFPDQGTSICSGFLWHRENQPPHPQLSPLSFSSGHLAGARRCWLPTITSVRTFPGWPFPPYPSAFPTHGFSHLALRLAHTPLQHEVAPKSMGQGRNGVGMWWRALWLAMGLLGSRPPPQKKNQRKRKSEEKKINSWGKKYHKNWYFWGMVWPGAALGLGQFGRYFAPQTRLKSRFSPQNKNRTKTNNL